MNKINFSKKENPVQQIFQKANWVGGIYISRLDASTENATPLDPTGWTVGGGCVCELHVQSIPEIFLFIYLYRNLLTSLCLPSITDILSQTKATQFSRPMFLNRNQLYEVWTSAPKIFQPTCSRLTFEADAFFHCNIFNICMVYCRRIQKVILIEPWEFSKVTSIDKNLSSLSELPSVVSEKCF